MKSDLVTTRLQAYLPRTFSPGYILNMKKIGLTVFLILYVGCAHSEKVLTADELTYGDVQVRSMLTDRKEMSFYKDKFGVNHDVGPGDEIWKWSAAKFAGQSLNEVIEWVPKPRFSGCALGDNNAGADKRVRIRVVESFPCGKRADAKLPFEYLWRVSAFELLNTEGADQFKEIYKDIKACVPMDRDKYIRRILTVEYQAIRKLNYFYTSIWLPWTIKNSIETSSSYWGDDLKPLDIWLDWLKNHKDRNGWHYHSDTYDIEIKPYMDKICAARGL